MQTSVTITAAPVREDRRLAFLPSHWPRHYGSVEASAFNFARDLIPNYRAAGGGFWNFVEISNGAGYLWPSLHPDHPDGTVEVHCRTNCYKGRMSPDAAGIVVTLFVLSHLSMHIDDDSIVEGFHLLRDYAGEHPEAAAIFSAID